jgi:UDP-perosamine 4-acetyltransferase
LAEKKLILLGGGGHCKVVIAQLRKLNEFTIAGILDRDKPVGTLLNGVAVIGADDDLKDIVHSGVQYALVTVGSTRDNIRRQALYTAAGEAGCSFPIVVSPAATVEEGVSIGGGTVVMPGCIVNVDAVIGENCIINTGAIIEHDCRLGSHCHIAPGVRLSGGVEIGEMSFIGAGSVLMQGVKVGRKAIVGAGCVVIRDVPDHSVVAGNPGRLIKTKTQG